MQQWISRVRQMSVAACLLALAGCGSSSTPTGTISGRIVDDLGNPVSGATVSVGSLTAQTGSDGSYTLGPVSAGAHSVSASLNGFAFPDKTVTVAAGKTVTVNVNGARTNHAPQITLTATPAQVEFVGGTVTLNVTATDADSDALVLTLTSASGKATLTNLGSGNYRAKVTLPANNTLVDKSYTFVLTASDGRETVTAQTTASVKGLKSPDPGGGGVPDAGI